MAGGAVQRQSTCLGMDKALGSVSIPETDEWEDREEKEEGRRKRVTKRKEK